MSTQTEILRLKELGYSQRKVAKKLNIDRGSVRRYWSGPPPVPERCPPNWAEKIDWDYVKEELKKVSIKIIYEEQGERIKLPSYQAFCSYLRNNYSKDCPPEVVLKVDRTPGGSVEVDYSGDSVQILSPVTGELVSIELFVGVLSYSGKIYAEFSYSQKLEDWINCHKKMFTFFGGTPSFIISDNCKTAVTKADKKDPIINQTYQDLCRHYNLVVDPADSYRPTHRPNVENAVKFIQTDFLARIRNKTFTSLFEINTELGKWLERANQKEIKGRGESRDFFFEKEKPLLRSLPETPYELFYFKQAKVHPDCHFQHEKNYYSVPHQYVGKTIDVKFNSKTVHAYFDCQKIATHKCSTGKHRWATDHKHYPEQKYVEFNYHLGKIKKQSESIGPNTGLLINKLMSQARYPLKTIRKSQAILALKNKFGQEALEYGCGQALDFEKLSFDNIKRFTKYYQHRPKDPDRAPERQMELICLQGGYGE